MKTFRSVFGMLAVALIASVFILSAGDANAAVGPVGPGELYSLGTLVAAGASAGIARLAACSVGPRIFFEAPNDGGAKSAEQLATEVKAEFQKSFDAVKAIADEALGKAKAGETLSSSIKEKADEALIKMNGLKEQVDQIEQKLARGGGDGKTEEQKSLGARFVEMPELKSMAESPKSGMSVSMSVKADITTATTDAAGSAGAGIVPNRLPGVQELPQRRLTVRNLLSPGRTDGPLIQYLQETGFTNAAAPVAEGALKPNSDIKLTDKDVSTKVIAHWFRASKQILSDFSQVRSMIDQRLLYGLGLVEEQQLLYGDGTGENLHGIVPQASAYAAPINLDTPTSIDMIRLMMLQAVLAEYPATGIVMHPSDWAWIETLKDTTGRYIIGNPQGTIPARLWGLPVVETPAMQVDKVLVGAFRLGAQIFDQWNSRIEVGFQNDDFVRNKVTILGEERLALAVYRPEAFVYGDFGRVA